MRIPSFLQMDNQLCCRGSNRYPSFVGLWSSKLCLNLRVESIFIPLGEPWRDGCIEKFQATFQYLFFRKIRFSDLQDLRRKAKDFEIFHNRHYRYHCIGGKTLDKTISYQTIPPRSFPGDFSWETLKERVRQGRIHLLRFIQSNQLLDIFNERFQVGKSLVYEYIKATIIVKEQKIKIFHQGRLVHEID